MLSVCTIIIAGLAAFSASLPAEFEDLVLHEQREDQTSWIKRDALDDDSLLPMQIGLTQNNLDKEYEFLMEVSHPSSKKYGQHYTSEEVIDLFAPSNDSSANKQWVQFDAPVSKTKSLHHTTYHFYEHLSSGEFGVGSDEYYISKNIQAHVDYITRGVKIARTRRSAHTQQEKRDSVSTNGWAKPKGSSPLAPAALYNITVALTAQPGNELGIFEGEEQFVDSEDLNDFYTHFKLNISNGTFPIQHGIDGGKNINKPADAGGESCTYSADGETGDSKLDPSYADPKKGGYEGALQCGVYHPTNVISISYGFPETGRVPSSYARRQCNECKHGTRFTGVSVVFASGDFGVGARELNDTECLGENSTIFNLSFPSACMYTTSVGATWLPAGASPSANAEVAATNFPSGGDFSNLFPRPDYQKAAVEAYFNSSAAPTYPYYTGSAYGEGRYNRSGRGYPDVSAIGQGLVTYAGGEMTFADGTSASAPIFASILTRINNERLAANKSAIGFVNPVLYAHPEALHDITKGDNPNCKSRGFQAGVAWDPVTGLGTPDYPCLLDVFMKLS